MSNTNFFLASRPRAGHTAGAGFVGSRVVEKLARGTVMKSLFPGARIYDLRNREHVEALFEQVRPSLVIHLAAKVGGIGGNQKHPARFFFDNAMMGIQLLDCAARFHVDKFVCIGTVCSYPKFTPVPFQGRAHLGWLSRGHERTLRAGKENAAGASASIQAAIWLECNLLDPNESITVQGQF
jgi:nucleoside-diphosphate-sugar epimerase